jgi:hypothetical protein
LNEPTRAAVRDGSCRWGGGARGRAPVAAMSLLFAFRRRSCPYRSGAAG